MCIIIFITLKNIIISTLILRNNYYCYELTLQLNESFRLNNKKHNTSFQEHFINNIC